MSGNPMSRRQFLKASSLALSGAVLAACGATPTATPVPTKAPAPTATAAPAAPQATAAPAAPAALPVNTTVTGTFVTSNDNETNSRKPAVDRFFQKFYPNMKVEYQITPSGYVEKLLAQIASGNVPDFSYIHESNFADFASQGALLPLNDYLDKRPLIDGNDKYQFDVFKRNTDYKGKKYTIATGAAFMLIRYNKDLFKAANVPLPKEGFTWDDFRSAAVALTKDTNGDGKPEQWGWTGWNPGWAPAQWTLMQSYGSDFYTDDLTKCILNNDAGVQVYEFLRSTWCGNMRCSPTPAAKTQLNAGTSPLFEGGLSAMDQTLSQNVAPTLKVIDNRFEMGIEIYPAGPKGPFVRTGGQSYGFPKGTKNPDIAWELLRWMIGDEEAAQLAAPYKNGNPLVRLDHILKYNVPEGLLKAELSRIITVGFQKYGTVTQYAPVGTFGSICSSNIDKLAACDITAKQCVDAIADAVNKELKDKL